MVQPINSAAEPNTIPQQTAPIKRNWRKTGFFLLLFLIIVIIGLLRSGVFVANTINQVIPTVIPTAKVQATPIASVDKTINWKSYVNTKYGFEIKYPNNWEINKSPGSPPEYTKEQMKNLSYIDFFEPEKWIEKDGNRISLGINTISLAIDMDNYGQPYSCQNNDIFKCWTSQPDYSNGNDETKRIYINDDEALEILPVSSNNPERETQVEVVFQRGSHLYKFILRCINEDCEKVKHDFDQILSTFTFLDQIQTNLKPSDSDLPAAGICGEAIGDIASLTINIDTSAPRCIKVLPSQKLKVINNSDQTITVTLASFNAVIDPEKEYTFDKNFGSFLADGVHTLSVSLYPGPEIWLKE